MDPKNLKWTDKLANELHKPVVKYFRKRKVIVNGIDEIWAADLVDMQSFSKFNDGLKYLLMVIDVFSKHGWNVPLKSVELYSTENEEKSCVVERWNRTLKDKMFKYFSANSTRKYNGVLDEMSLFSIGDRVRITKKKTTFEKGYTPRWTEEVFTVSKIQFTDPPTYKLTDDNGEEIQGTFYEQELQKTDQKYLELKKLFAN
ncbi:uncharacterized protein LOC136086839 [Hydra vulgaris]|uniref:Uncharacterized protein LOC136086839 n=1 Tax=Hydra vulgaris TaxID=6087 RepID=A0ABM4CU00_HYDVU